MNNEIKNNITEMFVLPDLGKTQLESFHRFVDQLLKEELIQFPKIYSSEQEFEFQLFGNQYILTEPTLSERETIYKSSNYISEIYIPAQLIQKTTGKYQKQTILLGSIPLMGVNRAFIINGISRVIVSQVLRSPGIYYNVQLDSNYRSIYTATIISDCGARFKLEIDEKRHVWARITKKRKISCIILLLAMGLTLEDMSHGISYPNILIINNQKRNSPRSQQDAMVELYKQLFSTSGDIVFSDMITLELQRTFFQQRCELGVVGRSNLNKRLNLNVAKEEIFLLPKDLLTAVDYLIKLSFGIGSLDDIDHLKNRRIRSIADLLKDQLKIALNKTENIIKQGMKGISKRKRLPNPKSLINSSLMLTIFKDFFGSHPLSQFLDQTNPLTEMVHKRRLSSLGPGGLTRRTATFNVRDIHPSHYGRICPIETSEGMNAGLIASLATHAQINDLGFIQSPFYKIDKSLGQDEPIYLSAQQDEYYKIVSGNSLYFDEENEEKQTTAVRYKEEFIATTCNFTYLRSVFPWQYFSIGASLIPFLEHDDANRALMGSNMQRQAVPVIDPEKPIVGTGLESQVALDSGSVVIAKEDLCISYVDGSSIEFMNNDNFMCNIKIINYQRSNNNTCIHQKPIVQQGQWIKKGQILADGATSVGGELALGKNILVAYMPWEGYNFEDAVLISERLVYDNIYTSIHIEKYEIEIHANNQGRDKITKDIPQLDSNLLRNLDNNGVIIPGSWVETGDILIGKLTPQYVEDTLRAPEGKLLQAIFGIQVGHNRDTSLRVPSGGQGRVIDVKFLYQDDNSIDQIEIIHVYILQKRKIQVGDKVAGRHGNKGIISKILPIQDMPYLQNGKAIDMVLSPLGVPSRMNVGQIFECLLGFAGDFLGKHYRIMPFDERYEREASRKLIFSELHKAKQKTGYPWIFEQDTPGKNKLFDGRTGETFNQPVTVGVAYMLKLIHQVDDKIHARSTGPYSLVTQQPVRGRSRGGGQRVGEMEVWALEGFGAAYVLQEMLTIKSDHIESRHEILGAIITGEPLKKPLTAPESFRLLTRELRCLSVEITHININQNNFQISHIEI
uniref:DNA-directed RNA polymerase subunit beta n=1 Tax=Coleochaete scutata TaxID=3125 RepID=A0A191T5N8_COLSC|nr:beta subunit of RNA polymerase [Coleochaete scutata]ANI25708.1 beta subunit of RNA polymerase [Coleochaete scutata]